MKVRQPGQSSESFSPDISYINGSLHSLNCPEPTVQQSGARRAFRARARRSARSVAAGGRIFRLRCWRSAIFQQATNVFGPSVLPVCDFQADQECFRPFSAAGLQFLSRPPAFSGLRCRRPAIFKQTTNVFGPLVLEVCDFSAGHQRFRPFSAAGLQFFDRPGAFSAF